MSYNSFKIMVILGIIANFTNYIINGDIMSIIICVFCVVIIMSLEKG